MAGVFVVGEVVSYVGFALVLNKTMFMHVDFEAFKAAITQEKVTEFRDRNYDRELGWRMSSNAVLTERASDGKLFTITTDDRGARFNPHPSSTVVISVYGDSFTLCSEVNDDETWPFYLSELSGSRVENWGVAGYGTDQALLRLQHNLPEHRTEIVVLAVFGENIKRLMNVYRPFYYSRSRGQVSFKPMLAENNGKIEWLPNPLTAADGLDDYYRAFDRAKEHDFWYALNDRRPRGRFPFTLALLQATRYVLFDRPGNLYEVEQASRKMDHIVEEFAALSERHRFTPVLLFIPSENDLLVYGKNGDYSYRGYLARLRTRTDLPSLRMLDLLERPFEIERFNLRPFAGHASPHGNQIVARAVFEAIEDVLPEAMRVVSAPENPD